MAKKKTLRVVRISGLNRLFNARKAGLNRSGRNGATYNCTTNQMVTPVMMVVEMKLAKNVSKASTTEMMVVALVDITSFLTSRSFIKKSRVSRKTGK